MRAISILSGLAAMPGTKFAGENAACSISAKKFSGLRFRVCVPTLTNGKSACGHTLVMSNGLNR